MREQVDGRLTTMFGIDAVDAFYGYRERAVLGPCNQAFGFQIPEMELQVFARAAR